MLTELLDVAGTSQVDNGGWLRLPVLNGRSMWAYNDNGMLIRHHSLGGKKRHGIL